MPASSPRYAPGDVVASYDVVRVQPLIYPAAVFYELVHPATGAHHIHIDAPDRENTFGVLFRTVPADSTGVAHILEHTVLCGSRRYPVRDPFFSMLKRSLSTFMNAFTASDWTMYPFATQNATDYHNLLDVYLDAAFFPRLEELSFKQEGWRLEVAPDAADAGHLQIKGVVYNEMKGAMSSPDQAFARSLLAAIYPDTPYRHNSGGEPAVIPQLTHEQLRSFHRSHYHPGNALFYTYGNRPVEDHLRRIEDKVLQHFGPLDTVVTVPSQPRWDAPREHTAVFPLDASEDPRDKSQAAVCWLQADIRDSRQVLTLTLLDQILLGNPASPLRQALIDSGLGNALCDASGFDSDNRDTLFVCGLKGIAPAEAARLETLVLDTLENLCRRGVDPALAAAAIHQLEFHRKEIVNTPYPYGLRLLLTFAGAWVHAGDVLDVLQFDRDLADITRSMAEERFWEERIRSLFLDNPHRLRYVLRPDPELTARQERELAADLRARAATLGPEDRRRLIDEARQLERLQESQEDVACLPTLTRNDVPPEVSRVAPAEDLTGAGTGTTCYRQPTADIFYVTAAVGAGDLPADLVPLAPFFCHAFTRTGTRDQSYVELARRIDAHTGGIGAGVQARTRYDGQGRCLPLINVTGKCLQRHRAELFGILADLIEKVDFADHARLQKVLLEYKAGLEAAVIHNGHRLAMSLAARRFSPACALSEAWHGIHQLKTAKALVADAQADGLDALAQRLRDIAGHLLRPSNTHLAMVGEGPELSRALAAHHPLNALAQADPAALQSDPRVPATGPLSPREGWHTSTAVAFVARVLPAARFGHPDAPVLAIISKMMRSLYLHREIREKGGAYGGFAVYRAEEGLFCFGSYRDPHIRATLTAYDHAADFLIAGTFSETDIQEAVLQVCADIDRPDPPGPAARKAFQRLLVGQTDEARQQFKTDLLAANRAAIQTVAHRTFAAATEGGRTADAVIASAEHLATANREVPQAPFELHPI